MEEVIGTISNKRYSNRDNGFGVIDVIDEQTGSEFVAVGILHMADSGERVKLCGDWVFHKQYGKQLKVISYEVLAPSTLKAIENYLAGGSIKGIGDVVAHMIVQKFGMDTFTVIEKQPQRLMEISGIGKVKMAMITSSYMQQRETRDVMMSLQEYDMTTNQAIKIYKLYGANCIARIRENPYRLIDDVENIGFKTADKIAKSAGIAHESEFRIRAGVKYLLEWARQEGHTYLPREVLAKATADTLNVDELLVREAISELIASSKLAIYTVGEVEGVFLPSMRYYESDAAKRLLMLGHAQIESPMFSVTTEIDKLENEYNIKLAPLQRDAIQTMFESGASVITGGPGTGKTTILKLAIGIMENWGIEYELAAPTGRAAKRMSAATGKSARTIHRLLEYNFNERGFLRDEENPLETDVVIIDEMSMVDCMLMHSLLCAISKGTRIIMVGDADQLPSVGAGNVLADIIRSNTIPAIRLCDIYRQTGRSLIITNAHRINNGQMPVFDDTELDFGFEEIEDIDGILKRIIELNTNANNTPLFTNEPAVNVQVLAPVKKGALGVFNLNRCLQEAMNPPDVGKVELNYGDAIFRDGDKVMQIKNDYTLEWTKQEPDGRVSEQGIGVFNGDIGTIMHINRRDDSIEVLFDDGCIAQYDRNRLEELELAYCISIHKSQGSEFPIVLLPLAGGSPMFMTRNLLYTAVTRAKTQVYILGHTKNIEGMVSNNRIHQRNSSLWDLLAKYDKIMPRNG